MSNPNREPIPPERPLAFDGYAAQPRRRPMPVTLMFSLLILAGVGGGVFYLYRGGVRSPGGPPEPVGVPVRDVRVAAPSQTQAPDPAAGLSIYKDDPNATPGAPAFTPPPEQPAPRSGMPAPVVTAAAPPSAVVSAQMRPATSAAEPAVGDQPPNSPKPVRSPSIDSLLADNTPPVVRKSPSTGDTLSPPVTKSASAALSAAARKPASGAGFVIQIGAFSSPALADKSWNAAAGLAAGSMAGKGKHIALVSKGGATLYRTDITGFDTREAAQAVCAKLSAAGRTCFVR